MNATQQERTQPLEIDHRTIKFLVGWIAILIGFLPGYFANDPPSLLPWPPIDSISESYWSGPWPQSLFVGMLFAIAAFMSAYNGFTTGEMIASKVAAVSALCVALYPCKCSADHPEIIPGVHYAAAGVMFAILAYFCVSFRRQTDGKQWRQAKRRAKIYLACAVLIVLAMVLLLINAWRPGILGIEHFTYYGEAAGLITFGFSWLLASRWIPLNYINHPKEQFKLLGKERAPEHPDIPESDPDSTRVHVEH